MAIAFEQQLAADLDRRDRWFVINIPMRKLKIGDRFMTTGDVYTDTTHLMPQLRAALDLVPPVGAEAKVVGLRTNRR